MPIRVVMKVLFVDQSSDLQQKWIHPLRNEGWGVIRAMSAEDADRMMMLHGDSIETVIVSEDFAAWAKRWDIPYLVLVKTWNAQEISRQKSAAQPAVAYLPMGSLTVVELVKAVRSQTRFTGGLKATGTESPSSKSFSTGSSSNSLSLEDVSQMMSQPQFNSESSIRFEAPVVTLAGRTMVTPTPSTTSAEEKPALTLVIQTPTQEEAPKEATRVTQVTKMVIQNSAESSASANAGEKTSMFSESGIELNLESSTQEATIITSGPVGPSSSESTNAGDPSKTVLLEQTSAEVAEVGGISLSFDTSEANPPEPLEFAPGEESLVEELPHDFTPNMMIEEEASSEQLMASGMPMSPASHSVHGSHTPSQAPNVPVMNQFAINPSPVYAPTDIETLRSYLSLREQDVAILTGQVRSSQDRIFQLEMQLKMEKARSAELQHMVQKQEQTLKSYNQDKEVELEVLYKQLEDMNQQLKERSDKARVIETKLRLTTEEISKVKERVRVDIRRIRVREKELENQLEILKKDSSALLLARDEKIMELKRKIDLLEFNMELVQEQYSKERSNTDQLRGRLKDAAQTIRQAGGLLDIEN